MIVLAFQDTLQQIIVRAAPALPIDLWWATGLVLLILALTAIIDAFTETVPDILVLLGLFALVGLEGCYGTWKLAMTHLRDALCAGFAIWLINYLWFKFLRYDALGMGDAKWTMLAVACFGFLPALGAWGLGACFAVLWITIGRLTKRKIDRVTFAPFLMIGLCASIYWLRFAHT